MKGGWKNDGFNEILDWFYVQNVSNMLLTCYRILNVSFDAILVKENEF